ncbi:MAG TPA: protein-glutamate O-methyltransferase CheR, partial [Rhizobium sp.]|nr:protein-glutamate O-methyltransferase CheR [Rhizobium sp.]
DLVVSQDGRWLVTGTEVSIDIGQLAERVAADVGLRFSEPRRGQITSAVRRVMAAHQIGADSLLQRLNWDQDLVRDLVSALAVGETHFFRDAQQFAFIRDRILPEIRGNRSGTPIRICSIGCSTGEEPYSLAILCTEAGLSEAVRITGVDIRRNALARARLGEYDAWSLRNLDPAVTERYFRSSGRRVRLKRSLTAQVRFRLLDVAAENVTWPDARDGYDLVLCRNVLVYYHKKAVNRIGRNLFECLSEGGWLITAPLDPLLSRIAPFASTTTDAGIVYRRLPTTEPKKRQEAGVMPAAKPKIIRSAGSKGYGVLSGEASR